MLRPAERCIDLVRKRGGHGRCKRQFRWPQDAESSDTECLHTLILRHPFGIAPVFRLCSGVDAILNAAGRDVENRLDLPNHVPSPTHAGRRSRLYVATKRNEIRHEPDSDGVMAAAGEEETVEANLGED